MRRSHCHPGLRQGLRSDGRGPLPGSAMSGVEAPLRRGTGSGRYCGLKRFRTSVTPTRPDMTWLTTE